jgi:hypothetical protein
LLFALFSADAFYLVFWDQVWEGKQEVERKERLKGGAISGSCRAIDDKWADLLGTSVGGKAEENIHPIQLSGYLLEWRDGRKL